MSSTGLSAPRLKQSRTVAEPIAWLRRNLFSSWFNSLLTLVLLWLIAGLLLRIFDWLFTQATWAPVVANIRLFWIGRYPPDQVWRVQLCLGLVLGLFGLSAGMWGGIVRAVATGLLGLMVLLIIPPFDAGMRLYFAGLALLIAAMYFVGLRRGHSLRWPVISLWIVSPLIILVLVRGFSGSATLPPVETNLWGGLMLTLLLAVVGIIASFPLGILLALGRRSRLPVVKAFCVAYIEIIRGVPLISVLFMAMIMLPLFLPPTVRVDTIVRVMVAITLFSAAYLAENVRGGLQAVPNGQIEAARALGLNIFQSTLLIVLPQALRAVIPAIVGQFISLFKDTSLVFIVGMIDLLGIASAIIHQQAWLTVTGGVQREVLLFTAFIYWTFCFTMARVARSIETRLGVGTR